MQATILEMLGGYSFFPRYDDGPYAVLNDALDLEEYIGCDFDPFSKCCFAHYNCKVSSNPMKYYMCPESSMSGRRRV